MEESIAMEDVEKLLKELAGKREAIIAVGKPFTHDCAQELVELIASYRAVGLYLIDKGEEAAGTNLIINNLKDLLESCIDAEFANIDHLQRFLTPLTENILQQLLAKNISNYHPSAENQADLPFIIYTPIRAGDRMTGATVNVDSLKELLHQAEKKYWIDTRTLNVLLGAEDGE